METYENSIIEAFTREVNKCSNRDSVNKLYRQVRVWNRFHHFFAKACTYDRYLELNETFKHIRWNKLDELKEEC